MFCYLKYTKHGFEIAVVGESEPTAHYAGIDVAKVIVRTMAVSGAIAGIVGFILVSGIKYTLSDSVAGGVGFTGITVAWLAQLNAFGMVLISFFLAVLEKGASTINTVTNNAIPESMSDMLTGIILFYFGTGPIRGFATTLIIGILCSFFTAVFLTRVVYEHFMNKDKLLNLILQLKFQQLWELCLH